MGVCTTFCANKYNLDLLVVLEEKSSKSVEFILWGPWRSVHDVTAIHPLTVEIVNITIPGALLPAHLKISDDKFSTKKETMRTKSAPQSGTNIPEILSKPESWIVIVELAAFQKYHVNLPWSGSEMLLDRGGGLRTVWNPTLLYRSTILTHEVHIIQDTVAYQQQNFSLKVSLHKLFFPFTVISAVSRPFWRVVTTYHSEKVLVGTADHMLTTPLYAFTPIPLPFCNFVLWHNDIQYL